MLNMIKINSGFAVFAKVAEKNDLHMAKAELYIAKFSEYLYAPLRESLCISEQMK